jgi:hypothetical protein
MAATLSKTDKFNLLFNQPVWMVSFQITERSLRINKFGSIRNLYRRAITGTRRLKNLSNRDYFKSIDLGLYIWRKEAPDSYRFSLYFTLKEGYSLNEKRLRWQLKRTITWNPIEVKHGQIQWSELSQGDYDNIQFIKGLYGPIENTIYLAPPSIDGQALQPQSNSPSEVDYHYDGYPQQNLEH